jgi:hypothetical protein
MLACFHFVTGINFCEHRCSCAPRGSGVLRAYDATNIRVEPYNSMQNITRDRLDSYVKFSVPTTADGKVFVGTQTSLNIYGLLTS